MNIESLSEEQTKSLLQNEVIWYYSDATDFKGPFTDNQIIQLIHNNSINDSVKMWSKKYDFWIPILDIKKFASIIEAKPVVVKTKPVEIIEEKAPEFKWKNSDEFWKYMEKKHPHLHHKPLIDFEVIDKAPHARPVWMAIAAGFTVSAVLGLTIYSQFTPSEIGHRALNKQQNNEAQIVKQSSLKKFGIRTQAFFADPANENFNVVVATNLSDDVGLTLKLEGVADTLVGGFEFVETHDSEVKNGYAEMSGLRPLYQGEYVLTVQCRQCETVQLAANTILYREKIFLGGQKNQQYDLALLRYHVDLRNQVREELDNLNQIDEALNSQLQSLLTGRADVLWKQMQSQLDVEHANMKEQYDSGKFFYKDILNILTKNFHIIHSIQSAKTQTETESLKNEFMVNSASLRRATNEMIKMPLTANGMPQKK